MACVALVCDKDVFQSFESRSGGLRWRTLFVGGVLTRAKMLCLTKVSEVVEARGWINTRTYNRRKQNNPLADKLF